MINPRTIVSRIFLSIVFLATVSTVAHAQETIEISGDPELLISDGSRMFMQPRWSPVSDDLIVTGTSYTGLWRVTPDGSVLELSDERAAGFQMSWSPDGKYIASRVARYDNRRRQNAVVVYNTETAARRPVTQFENGMPAAPAWLSEAVLAIDVGGQQIAVDPAGNTVEPESSTAVFAAEANRITRTTGGSSVDVLESAPGRDILNLETAGDGSMIVYEEMGGNLFLARADGSGRMDLGRGHRARWSPDSQWIIYMVTEDDGHVFTSSDLYAARASDGHVVRLTATPDVFEMNPDWSYDGQSIAYDDDRGSIYTVSISTR